MEKLEEMGIHQFSVDHYESKKLLIKRSTSMGMTIISSYYALAILYDITVFII